MKIKKLLQHVQRHLDFAADLYCSEVSCRGTCEASGAYIAPPYPLAGAGGGVKYT